jgi:hypothetical protein
MQLPSPRTQLQPSSVISEPCVSYTDVSLKCPQGVLVAICDLLILLPATIKVSYTSKGDDKLPRGGLQTFLGPLPLHWMQHVCQEVLLTSPSAVEMELSTAFSNLVDSMTEAVTKVNCSCGGECDFKNGWPELKRKKRTCKRLQVWKAIGRTVQDGLACFFVRAGPNVSVSGCVDYDYFHTISVPGHITRLCRGGEKAFCWADSQRFLNTVL